jgi:hypothetical protein
MIITVNEANAWADKSKLILDTIDPQLATSVTDQVFSRISPVYEVASWTDNSNTPSLVCKITAMLYVAWIYERAYSEDGGQNTYSARLFEQAYGLLDGIASGALSLSDVDIPVTALNTFTPGFLESEPVFTMGQIW